MRRNTFSFVTEYIATSHIVIPKIDLQQRVWNTRSFRMRSSVSAQLSHPQSSRFTTMERYRERLRARRIYRLVKKLRRKAPKAREALEIRLLTSSSSCIDLVMMEPR